MEGRRNKVSGWLENMKKEGNGQLGNRGNEVKGISVIEMLQYKNKHLPIK
jgi:hypothetical protein